MHFHLPKPLHGWREFVGEVGIIVLGVLIALAAEQVVEAQHWRHEVATERASLLQEARDSRDGILLRQRQQPCVNRRLDEIHTILERHRLRQPLGLIGQIGKPAWETSSRGTWQIALTGQALAHMPSSEKLAFSDLFASYDDWDREASQESEIWTRFTVLNSPDLMTEEGWNAVTDAYARAVGINDLMRQLAPFMLTKTMEGMPKEASAVDLSRFNDLATRICKPILAPAPKE
jgi:hypothetical protein